MRIGGKPLGWLSVVALVVPLVAGCGLLAQMAGLDGNRGGAPPSGGSAGAQVRVSHILYAPNHDPAGAATIAADDPAWLAAKTRADAVAAELRAIADPADRERRFRALAVESDDTGSGAAGGQLDWATFDSYVAAFATAAFDPANRPGDIVGPVQTEFGWHVILFQERRAAR